MSTPGSGSGSGASAQAQALKTWCLEHGPKYAHPRFIQIIEENELPLNGAGKVDRALARTRLAALSSPEIRDRP